MSALVNVYVFAAILSIAAWIVIAFVVAWPTGWAHLPLILGVVFLARAIVGNAK